MEWGAYQLSMSPGLRVGKLNFIRKTGKNRKNRIIEIVTAKVVLVFYCGCDNSKIIEPCI